jgi:hypothetical protein
MQKMGDVDHGRLRKVRLKLHESYSSLVFCFVRCAH